MIRSATQNHRPIAVFTPFGDDVLLLDSFRGCEGLSELFQFDLRMVSGDANLDPRQILGRNVTLLLDHEVGSPRFFNGLVSSFSLVDIEDRQAIYQAEVVPWLWFLKNTSDCRIFQKKTVVEIIEKIFAEFGFADFETKGLQSKYRKREYCVQYRESDFEFVSRLMEEEGIWYYFRQENGKHTLVLADSVNSYFEIANDEVSVADLTEAGVVSTDVTNWKHGKQALTGRWAATDFNYGQPSSDLRTAIGSAIPALSALQLEKFDYPGRFSRPDEGRQQVQVRMQGEEAKHEWISGEGVRATFTPGGLFRVVSHPNPAEEGRGFVLRRVKYHAGSVGKYVSGEDGSELPWNTVFEAIPDKVLFRPERTTPQAVVEGPQTAVVVGPRGEEIYTDKDGRIKVQFHWDREGRKNENSSCWVRVSQTHAGAGWGSIDIPRIGEEVIVSFLEGDPDQPVVKGRVYNGAARVPFGLPGEMTRSGAKSNTHKGSGYNEMSMDDTAGKEQIRTNAQFNMDTTVGNSQTLAVGVDRVASIGNNDTLTTGVNSIAAVGNDCVETTGNNQKIIAGNNIVIDAGTSLTLKCGMSTIHMNQAGVVTISGQNVSSLARASNSIIAPMTEIAGAMMLVQAGAICLDVGGIKHIKSKGNTSIAGSNVNVQGGEVVIKGAPIKLGEAGATIVKLAAPGTGDGQNKSKNAPTHPKGGQLIQQGNGDEVIVLIGGGGDASTGNVRDGLSASVMEKYPNAHIVYVPWDGDTEAAEWLAQNKIDHPDANLQLIGHSYGGDSAMQIAEQLLGKVDGINVLTLDPVAHSKTQRPDNVSNWDNIYIDGISDYTDIIANLGGKWGKESKANSNTKMPNGHSHGDSNGMFDYHLSPNTGRELTDP